MRREYCAVGPTFVLVGGADPSETDTLILNAVRGHEGAASLSAARHDDIIQLSEPAPSQSMSDADIAESLRLFARVAADFWAYRFPLQIRFTGRSPGVLRDALKVDGFSRGPDGAWQRPAGVFIRHSAQAATMEEAYQDLYSVPWNFVPRESDVYGPMMAEAGSPLRVLDLGCGLGKNVAPVEAGGHRVYGTDTAYSAIRRCREIVDHPERFVVGSGVLLPWRNQAFDRVLDVGALHCMPRELRAVAVAEIARVLEPGGRLYSRFFKPRHAAWLRLQPMAVSEFGLPVDEVVALLERDLTCEAIREEPSLIYVTAVKA